MKPFSLFLAGTMLLLASCSEEIDNTSHTGSTTEPGTYIVGINLNMEVPLSKGISYGENGLFSFDQEYSDTTIYLHCGKDNIAIPVYENSNCGEGCKGFTYKICTNEKGNTTLTPIDQDGNESELSLDIVDNKTIYFSSSSEDVWEASISSESVPHDKDATLYQRTKENNVELFRSTNDLSIDDLKNGGQLDMKRVCSGFTFFCTFTDRTDKELTEEDFKQVMGGESPKNFTIKIYIGGAGFTNEYNISNQEGGENHSNGYYASGNSFKEGEYGNTDAVPLRKGIDSGKNGSGYGYATIEGNELITPVIDEATLKAYIYITHKEQTVYTEIEATSVTGGNFYRIGADIDIRELAAAFAEYEAASADTRSASAPRLFTPKSLVTHIEY